MKIQRIIKVNKKSKNNEEKKCDIIKSKNDFWGDDIKLNNYSQKDNIKINNKNNFNNKNIIKNINSTIIIKKSKDEKTHYQYYFNRLTKRKKKKINKIQKSCSEANLFPKNFENKRYNKLYFEGLISMKVKLEKSMEEKRKKDDEYKNYSYSPILYTHSSKIKNEKKKNQNKSINKNNNNKLNLKNRNKLNDIYERNKIWKQNIEAKNKKKILKTKKIETNAKFTPSINDCIMKTDESFINKNSIEYQAFIEKLNLKQIKENLYAKNQRNNFRYDKNKIKNSIEVKKKNAINNNKNREMKRFRSFNNREIYNIFNCRKKYGLNDFFNGNEYETTSNNYFFNDNELLPNKKLDLNDLFFRQKILNSPPLELSNRQTCFNFNDALFKLVGKK